MPFLKKLGRFFYPAILAGALFGIETVPHPTFGKQASNQQLAEEPLPAWVEQGSFRHAGSDFLLVTTEGYSTPLEANNALTEEVTTAVSKALDRKLGEGIGQRLAISNEYIKIHLMNSERLIIRPYKDEFTEELAQRLGTKYGKFFRAYTQLELDDSFYEFAESRWLDEQTFDRVVTLGACGLVILSLLTIGFGYLRLNHATRGFYSTRLLTIGVAAAILLAAAAIWFLNNVVSL